MLFPDLQGNLRGKMVDRTVVDSAAARAEGLPTTDLLLAVDPRDEPITTLPDMGLEGGAKDLLLRADMSTMRPVPWFPRCQLVLGDLYETDGGPCEVAPRQVLQRALGTLEEVGIRVMAAFEFEFRLFRADSWEPAATGLSYSPSTLSEVADFVETLRRYADCLQLGLNVVHSEGAPGLLEVNVGPQDGVWAADTAALLRLAASEAARAHGMRASFMAKPTAHEEGSSAHVHFSMWDGAGENVLGRATPDDELYRRAAWGVLANLPALSLIYNPTINSYKRLVPGYFAPLSASCGVDDRSFALRALLRGSSASRFELRRPGADCNPYLTLAAIAASLHLGLTAEHVPERGQVDRHDGALPTSLEGAVSEFRRRGPGLDGVLGPRFCDHYVRSREWELRAWQNSVSDWERERYG
ncbi:glutamine synthetase family protein [Pseudonocardia kujensis]|uniref:glutamine synthetase family protein n=1 Tax=Pseudonocardia kujensis TaxID=1128675 RepID=UPI001E2EE481|nr:glutamine synthetase family protein [Pseudonocardia kujensis]MCE0765008.1 glutamine synthetase family protein [Pseudonocardia kujensis]